VVVARLLPIARENELTRELRQRVDLRVRHDRLARAVGDFASHVVGVADSPVRKRRRVRQRFVAAAGTNEKLGAGGVTRDEQTERRLTGDRIRHAGECVLVVLREDPQGGVCIPEIPRAKLFLLCLVGLRAWGVKDRVEDENQGHHDQEFDQAEATCPLVLYRPVKVTGMETLVLRRHGPGLTKQARACNNLFARERIESEGLGRVCGDVPHDSVLNHDSPRIMAKRNVFRMSDAHRQEIVFVVPAAR
jgi:hypothetical protein